MPYKTEVTITAKTNNVDKTAKQLENIDSTIDKVNKKSLNVKSVGLEGLDKMTLKELQDLMSKADTLGLGKFKGNIAQEIANRQTVSPEASESVAEAVKEGMKEGSAFGLKSIGALFGFSSLIELGRKIIAQNEALTTAVSAFVNGIAQWLKPVLDFIAGIIGTLAKLMGGVATTTKKVATAVTRQVASFDEINNLTTGTGGGGNNASSTSSVQQLAEDFVRRLKEMITGLFEVVGGLAAALFYGPIMLVQAGLGVVASIIGVVTAGLAALVQGLWAGVKGFFSGFSEGFKKARADGKSVLGSILSGLWNGLKTGFASFINTFKTTFVNTWTTIKTKWIDPIFNAVENIYNKAFKPALQMILNGLGRIVNGFIGMVNSVISKINNLPGVHLNSLNYWAVPQLAKGGLVNSGQLFIANENGAEMIGRMGNQTAVANNEQIVEGIKRGVEEAMSGRNQTITLVVDGKTLTSIVVDNIKAQSRVLGRSVI